MRKFTRSERDKKGVAEAIRISGTGTKFVTSSIARGDGLGRPAMATADRLYRRAVAFTRFFSRGWGPVETYEK